MSGTSLIAQQAINWLGVAPGAPAQQLGVANIDPVVAQEQYLQTRMQQTESMESLKRPSNVLTLIGTAVLTFGLLASKSRKPTTRT